MSAVTILALTAAILGIILSYWKTLPGVIIAYASVICSYYNNESDTFAISSNGLIFWGIATLIVLGLSILNASGSLTSRAYPLTGAVVGGFLGIISNNSQAALIIGAAIGAILAAFAFSRTPDGKTLTGSSRGFADYIGASCLPAIVIASMAITAIFVSIF